MIRSLFAAATIAMIAGSASATVFTDSAGDTFTSAGGGILDILSLEVTNDATSLNFKFTVAGPIDQGAGTDWGKYMVIMDTHSGGDSAGDGWARPISMSSGADTWLGSWVDSGTGGLENRTFSGGAWNLTGATYNGTPGLSVAHTTSTVTLSVLLADVGLAGGGTFTFDAFTSGGGNSDSAVDSAANPNPSIFDWSDPYDAGGSNPVLSYTVSVPGAGSAGLAGVAGLVALRRRR